MSKISDIMFRLLYLSDVKSYEEKGTWAFLVTTLGIVAYHRGW